MCAQVLSHSGHSSLSPLLSELLRLNRKCFLFFIRKAAGEILI